MGVPTDPALVTPIVGVLAASEDLLAAARDVIERNIDSIDLCSRPVEWAVSAYYRREMGEHIWRQYVSLAALHPADELAALKRHTNQLEDRWRMKRGRAVNLDPGYVDLQKLVLASTKDAAHRVYIGGGIYAEATLHFAHGAFHPWPYTYPDYASEEAVQFFNRVRERLRARQRATPRLANHRARSAPRSAR